MSGDIEDKPQPLMEHLIELRSRLIWAVGAFFAAFLVCFYFAKALFDVLVLPFKWAVQWAGLDHRAVAQERSRTQAAAKLVRHAPPAARTECARRPGRRRSRSCRS